MRVKSGVVAAVMYEGSVVRVCDGDLPLWGTRHLLHAPLLTSQPSGCLTGNTKAGKLYGVLRCVCALERGTIVIRSTVFSCLSANLFGTFTMDAVYATLAIS